MQYYYLRYFSKKAGQTIERIAVGKPTQGSRGTMLYNDYLQGGTRSFCLQNLCEQRKINSQNELEHYTHHLRPNLAQILPKNTIQKETTCKPRKESEDFAGDQIKESGYTAEQEEQLLWEQHTYELQMQQYYNDRN